MVMNCLMRLRRGVGMVVIVLTVVVPVAVLMVVMRVVVNVFSTDTELRGRQAGARHPLRPDDLRINGQTAERTPDRGERHAGVDQRAEDHVAGCARETVEIQRSQSRPSYPARTCILPDSISE